MENKEILEIQKILEYCCNVYDEKGRHVRNKCNCYDCKYYDDTNGVCCSFSEKEAIAIYDAGYRKQLPEKAITLTEQEREQLKAFCLGEWVETALIEKALNIDFGQGLKMFDFSREATWNPAPLNGQRIITKFKLKK